MDHRNHSPRRDEGLPSPPQQSHGDLDEAAQPLMASPFLAVPHAYRQGAVAPYARNGSPIARDDSPSIYSSTETLTQMGSPASGPNKPVTCNYQQVEQPGFAGRIKRTRRTWSERARSQWFWQIFCAASSVLCVLLIAGLLAAYDGAPISDWQFMLSLNTIVSILGTTAKAALSEVLAASLSQFKWLWLAKRRRPLNDFVAIEEASRGASGSWQMLFSRRWKSVGSFGAIIVVLTVAMDPFFQALIQYHGQLVTTSASQAASVSSSPNIDAGTELAEYLPFSENTDDTGNVYPIEHCTFPDFEIKTGFTGGLQRRSMGEFQGLQVFCPSGNCTWPVFATLGVSSMCVDISSKLYNSTRNLTADAASTEPVEALPDLNRSSRKASANTDRASTILSSSWSYPTDAVPSYVLSTASSVASAGQGSSQMTSGSKSQAPSISDPYGASESSSPIPQPQPPQPQSQPMGYVVSYSSMLPGQGSLQSSSLSETPAPTISDLYGASSGGAASSSSVPQPQPQPQLQSQPIAYVVPSSSNLPSQGDSQTSSLSEAPAPTISDLYGASSGGATGSSPLPQPTPVDPLAGEIPYAVPNSPSLPGQGSVQSTSFSETPAPTISDLYGLSSGSDTGSISLPQPTPADPMAAPIEYAVATPPSLPGQGGAESSSSSGAPAPMISDFYASSSSAAASAEQKRAIGLSITNPYHGGSSAISTSHELAFAGNSSSVADTTRAPRSTAGANASSISHSTSSGSSTPQDSSLKPDSSQTFFYLQGSDSPYLWNYDGFSDSGNSGSTFRGAYMTAMSTSDPEETLSFSSNETLLVAYRFIKADDGYRQGQNQWPDVQLKATECGLFLSAGAINASVDSGVYRESMLNRWSMKVPDSWQPSADDPYVRNTSQLRSRQTDAIYHSPSEYVKRSDFQLSIPSDNEWKLPSHLSASQRFLDSTMEMLRTALMPDPTKSLLGQPAVYKAGTMIYTADVLQPLYESDDLDHTFFNVASSMTIAMRNRAGSSTAGTTQTYVVRIRIRWWYLTMPVVLILGGIGTLAFVMWQTKQLGVPAWPGDIHASLLYGLDPETRSELRAAAIVEGVEGACEKMVKRTDTPDGCELQGS